MKLIRGVSIAILLSLLVSAQTPLKRAEFEVASIKPSAEPTGQVNVGVHIDGSQVRCTYLSMRDYVSMAYQVKDYQISAPDWIASERYDISAKLPAGASGDQVGDMIKTLLEDRFGLKLHRDSKEFPVYALVAAKVGFPNVTMNAAATVTANFTVSDFTITTGTPIATVMAGAYTNFTFTVTFTNLSDTVTLSAPGLPSGRSGGPDYQSGEAFDYGGVPWKPIRS